MIRYPNIGNPTQAGLFVVQLEAHDAPILAMWSGKEWRVHPGGLPLGVKGDTSALVVARVISWVHCPMPEEIP